MGHHPRGSREVAWTMQGHLHKAPWFSSFGHNQAALCAWARRMAGPQSPAELTLTLMA